MAKGHSKEIRKTKKQTGETVQIPKTLKEGKKISLNSIRTATSVEKNFEEMNIQQVNLEELFEDDKFFKDLSIEESTNEMYLKDEYGEIEDEDIDFDEPSKPDPFDIEDRDRFRRDKYIVEVFIRNNTLDVQFVHVPMFNANNNLINDTLSKRYGIFKNMASFIANKQKGFFVNPDFDNLNLLKQKELVEHLKDEKGYSLGKAHISRMLDALYFRIKGKGYIPAKRLFERGILGLKKGDMLKLAKEFLINYKNKVSQHIRAKSFHEYLEKKNIKIKLSESRNEHDKYKYLMKILKEAEKEYEKTQN